MTKEQIAEIEYLQGSLRTLAGESVPKGVIDGDSDCGAVVANEAGLLRLAIDILDAARGIDSAAPYWLTSHDWTLEGFRMREEPEMLIPPPRPVRDHAMLGLMLLTMLLTVWGFIDGASRAWNWIFHLHS